MDLKLIEAGYLAIPLKANVNSTLNPQPNFLIIDNLYGRLKADIPTIGTMVCQNGKYYICSRKLVEATESRPAYMEEVIYTSDVQAVPVVIVPALSDYEYLSEGVAQVNGMLSLFGFRGSLSGFILEVDTDVLAEIILALTPPPPPEPEEEEPPTEEPE